MAEKANHAALMDSVYRRQRHIYDVTRKYYLFGRDRLIDRMKPKPGSAIVEVGCGTARNLIRMARLYPDAQLFGLDASKAMLQTAEETVARHGLESRISLAHGYAEALSPAMFGRTAPFDEIVFSYSLSMIPDWKQALRAAADALGPAGRVHIVDFGDLKGLVAPLRSLLLGWLGLFHVEPRAELLGEFESLMRKVQYFQVLTGRYAFLLTCGADDLPRNFSCGPPVTGGGQNSPGTGSIRCQTRVPRRLSREERL